MVQVCVKDPKIKFDCSKAPGGVRLDQSNSSILSRYDWLSFASGSKGEHFHFPTMKTSAPTSTSTVSSRLQKISSEFLHRMAHCGYPLKKHQWECVQWMSGREQRKNMGLRGGLLFDDPGLGKTVQIAALMHVHPINKNIVIVPSAVLHQWKKTLEDILPPEKLNLIVYHSSFRKQKLSASGQKTRQEQFQNLKAAFKPEPAINVHDNRVNLHSKKLAQAMQIFRRIQYVSS